MTATATPPAGAAAPAPPELVTLTIDGTSVSVPKGTLVIRAAEQLGISIPRFCDHPLLDPVGACRQCLVEVALPGRDGTLAKMPKPQASCTMTASEGMSVTTQLASAVVDKAQRGVMELLLINHPLDCPVCDKGGECPLQNQAMEHGRTVSRFEGFKRTYPKPVRISSQVLLDRERCVLCARCTRFSDQIAGDPFIALVERGALQQVGIYEDQPFESYFSGNTVQICPVGALTGARYRFRSRPFDLVSTPGVCEHCASGCSLRTDHRRGVVLRRMAGLDMAVNEEWNCDKGRWAFTYATEADRLTTPLLRGADGVLRPAGWPEALEAAAAGLRGAQAAAVLTGGRVSAEDAYAYSKFARVVLGTNDVDFRARPHSGEEADFLAAAVVGSSPESGAVSYADLSAATTVLLVGFEPEEESPIVFLRLRRAVRKRGLTTYAVAPFATRGVAKLGGRLVPAAPGTEAEILAALLADDVVGTTLTELAAALREPGAVILVGERLATIPGALSAALALAAATGARLAWVPRRAGERGALEAGALPTLLPGGRPVADADARAEVAAVWGVIGIPDGPGRDTAAILAGAATGAVDALVIGGVEAQDLGLVDPAALRRAFVVSLEVREGVLTDIADVVLPVAPHQEKSGTYVNWEGRLRPFPLTLSTQALSDHRALHMLADEFGVHLATRTLAEIHAEWEELGPWAGPRVSPPSVVPAVVPSPGPGEVVLATWHHLLDSGRLQDGEPFLAGTAPAAAARVSAATAAAAGLADADMVTVGTSAGQVSVPVVVTDDMVDHVVWLPTR
jgi:NADH-quinone oxidoreductase subunit G